MCLWSVSWIIFEFYGPRERNWDWSEKYETIDEAVPPTNKIELQSLLGKINFIRRFISNLSKRILPFSPLLKLKNDQEFKWGDVYHKAFEEIKEYMKSSPVLVPPQQGKPFKLYMLANSQTIGSALMQEFEGNERVIFYELKTFGSRNKIFSYWKVMFMLIFLLH